MTSALKTAVVPPHGLLFALVFFSLATPAFAQLERNIVAPTRSSIEQDLLRRLRSQPVSQGTLESLSVPTEFLQRVADRIIRMDYQKRFRMVAKEPGADQAGSMSTSGNGANAGNPVPSSPTTAPGNRTVIGAGVFGGLVILIAVLARRRRQRGAHE